MYTKTLLLFLLTSMTLFAYTDSDMDGVEDKVDQCPNTLFSELVDINGCTVKKLKDEHHFDIIYGINFSQANYTTTEETDTTTQTLQVDYYYKNYSLQVSSSYYSYKSDTYDNSGMNDLFIGGYYKLNNTGNLNLRLGAGIILPTYDSTLNNNNTDYTASINASYTLNNINLFAGHSYTIVNDDDIAGLVSYKNTNSMSVGLGFYPMTNLYTSVSYNSSDSIYKDIEDIRTASLYAFYSIDANWFTSLSYSSGLSDSASDNSLSLRVGYYF